MSTVKKTLLLATPVVLLCGWFAYDYLATNLKFIPTTEEERAAIRAEVAAQDENVFYKPAQSPRSIQPANPLNNVYFGDLHIHSNLSADAYLLVTGAISMRPTGSPKASRRQLRRVKSSKLRDPWTSRRLPTTPRALGV